MLTHKVLAISVQQGTGDFYTTRDWGISKLNPLSFVLKNFSFVEVLTLA